MLERIDNAGLQAHDLPAWTGDSDEPLLRFAGSFDAVGFMEGYPIDVPRNDSPAAEVAVTPNLFAAMLGRIARLAIPPPVVSGMPAQERRGGR